MTKYNIEFLYKPYDTKYTYENSWSTIFPLTSTKSLFLFTIIGHTRGLLNYHNEQVVLLTGPTSCVFLLLR